MFNADKLLQERDTAYGGAWKLTGLVVNLLKDHFIKFLEMAPQYSFSWMIMQCKLVRMLSSPYEPDHYKDLIGYATLCLNDIERSKDANTNVPSTLQEN